MMGKQRTVWKDVSFYSFSAFLTCHKQVLLRGNNIFIDGIFEQKDIAELNINTGREKGCQLVFQEALLK